MPVTLDIGTTLLEARWLIPVVPRAVFEKHTLVMSAGRIVDLLPRELARARYPQAQIVSLHEHLLMPGLINLHTHAAMCLLRGLADDVPLMLWLKQHIWPAEKALLSSDFVHDATRLACAEMLASGTTTFNDMYFYPQATANVVTQIGMRAHLGITVLEFPTPYASTVDDYLHQGFSLHEAWHQSPLISLSLAPHAPYTVSDSAFEKVLFHAQRLGLGIHTHLHETQVEIEQSQAKYGLRPLARLARLGLLEYKVVMAHGVHLLSQEINLLSRHDIHVAHCPSSNLKLGSGIAPIAALIKAGVNVGVGTDGSASNNRLDMLRELHLVALLTKGASGDASIAPALEVIAMATINAAQALGLEREIGSLEVGKVADMIAVKLNDVYNGPCFDAASHLVYVCGRENVSHTWVNGRLLYCHGEYTSLDSTQLHDTVSHWQNELRKYAK